MSTDDLTAAHEKVENAIRLGILANFARADDPDELPSYDDDDFWRDRTVDGVWLAGVAQGPQTHSGTVVKRGTGSWRPVSDRR
jgi:hypothetical protein